MNKMKKLISVLVLCSASLCSFAQDSREEKKVKTPSPTETNFNMPVAFVNIRDYAYLPDNARMIVELVNANQYRELANLPTVITRMMQEISFYKDSLENGIGSVRIDYAIDKQYPFNKLRFTRHTSEGEIFMTNANDVSRLKLDQDTVRLYFRDYPLLEQADEKQKNWEYPMYATKIYQVTFCVNSYKDLAKIVADSTSLRHALDTLYATKRANTLKAPYRAPSSARYNPYAPEHPGMKRRMIPLTDVRFKQYGGLVESDNAANWDVLHRADVLTTTGNLGMGLVRNTFAPYAEVGVAIVTHGKQRPGVDVPSKTFGLSIASYFMFERNTAGNYDLYANNFVNAYASVAQDMTLGLGYLYWQQGGYFTGNTFKLLLNVKLLKKGLTLSPEIIVTDDFNQIFPGLTLKVF